MGSRPCERRTPNVLSSRAPFSRCLWQCQLLGKPGTRHLISDGLAEAPGGVQHDVTKPHQVHGNSDRCPAGDTCNLHAVTRGDMLLS